MGDAKKMTIIQNYVKVFGIHVCPTICLTVLSGVYSCVIYSYYIVELYIVVLYIAIILCYV
jgi:hypothetical protein